MKRADWETALSAQSEILALMTSPVGKKYAKHWLFDRELKYGRNARLPSELAFNSMVEDLMVSEPLFVSLEMHHLALDAMQTFNAREPLHEEDVLFPAGFAYLAEPYSGPDMHGNLAVFRCISWRLIDMDLSPEFADGNGVDAGVQKCLRISLWSNINDPDDYTEEWAKGVPDEWGVLHITVLPLQIAHDIKHTAGEGDRNAHWLTYLRVLHRLMAERITTSTRTRTSRPVWREARRRGMPDIRDVIVVELRRVTIKHDEESSEAHYSHRFMVRGHWRDQWYPSLGIHRQKWISPYVKGPDDGELILKDRVWVWDR